jgi:uncharacterized membrane protein YccC
MRTRVGKIARLPKEIREQLNQRLENGEPGKDLLNWLNQLPETQKILADHFAGQPIRPQNLSDWKSGGYQDWLRHQQLREQTRWTAEQSSDLERDINQLTISIAEDIAIVMSAELALQVQALGRISDPKERFRQFRLLARELSRIRRDDQRVIRGRLQREKFESTLEPVEPAVSAKSETSASKIPDDEKVTKPGTGGSLCHSHESPTLIHESRHPLARFSVFPRHQPSRAPSILPNPA